MTVEIADLAVHFHIGDGGVGKTINIIIVDVLQQLIPVLFRQSGIIFNRLPHLLLHFVCHSNSARLVPAEGLGVQHFQRRRFAIGYAVNLTETSDTCTALVAIHFVDFLVPLDRTRRNDGILKMRSKAAIDNLTTLLAHQDIVQFQIRVRFVFDGNRGSGIGMEYPCTDEVISFHIDIATAGSDVRNLHIIDRATGAEIGRNFAVGILFHQPLRLHLILDSCALRNITCHYRSIRCAVIGGNQFVQLLQAFAQGVGIVKCSLGDAGLHPIVGQVVVSRDRQPIRNSTIDGHVDGIGGTCDEGTGHVDVALSHRCIALGAGSRTGGQEFLVRAGAALGPVPEAFVFDDLFLATASDSIDVLGGAHHSAHVHRSLVGYDAIVHPGNRNGNHRVIVRAGLEIRIQIGQSAFFVGSCVKTYIVAALDGARDIHVAGAVHVDIVLGDDGADNSGVDRAVHLGFQGLVVIGGEDDVLRRGRLFVAEGRATLHVDFIMDVKIELADGIRDRNRAAALGLHKVRQVIIGGSDVFL